MIKSVKNVKIRSFEEIRLSWDAILKLSLRDKLKAFRQITFEIGEHYKANKASLTLDELDFFIRVYQATLKTLSYPQAFSALLSKMISHKLALEGNPEAEIILKIAGKVVVESGVIGIGDPSIQCQLVDYSDKELLTVINKGERFYFHIDGDGEYNVQLRVIKAKSPILTAKEYKMVTSTTQTAILHIPSGKVAIADMGLLEEEKQRVMRQVSPGNYKVTVFNFCIPKKLHSFYVVLCATEETLKQPITAIDTLF